MFTTNTPGIGDNTSAAKSNKADYRSFLLRSVVARKSKYFTRIYFLRTWKHKIIGNNLTRVADLISAGITIGGLVCKYAGYAHVLSVPSWATLCNINPAATIKVGSVGTQTGRADPSKLGVPAHKLCMLTARSRRAGTQGRPGGHSIF